MQTREFPDLSSVSSANQIRPNKQWNHPFCTLHCQHNHQLGSLLGLCGRICSLKRSSSLSSHANPTEVHSCTAALIGVGALTSLDALTSFDPTSRFHRESLGNCPRKRHGKCASFPVAYNLEFIPFTVGLLPAKWALHLMTFAYNQLPPQIIQQK